MSHVLHSGNLGGKASEGTPSLEGRDPVRWVSLYTAVAPTGLGVRECAGQGEGRDENGSRDTVWEVPEAPRNWGGLDSGHGDAGSIFFFFLSFLFLEGGNVE